ncbi:MAG: hypothetical protein Q8930_13135 [Bacillota bacterium]|nr:hypothetical protein [Bacillota bacterium]
MKGKIYDKNMTEAFVMMENGETLDISITRLPRDVNIGDTVDIPRSVNSITNDKLVDFF